MSALVVCKHLILDKLDMINTSWIDDKVTCQVMITAVFLQLVANVRLSGTFFARHKLICISCAE